MDGLGDEAQTDLAHVRAFTDPKSNHYLAWLQPHRNVNFHYADMHPLKAEHDSEEIQTRCGEHGRTSGSSPTRVSSAGSGSGSRRSPSTGSPEPTTMTIRYRTPWRRRGSAAASAAESASRFREDSGVADLRESALALRVAQGRGDRVHRPPARCRGPAGGVLVPARAVAHWRIWAALAKCYRLVFGHRFRQLAPTRSLASRDSRQWVAGRAACYRSSCSAVSRSESVG